MYLGTITLKHTGHTKAVAITAIQHMRYINANRTANNNFTVLANLVKAGKQRKINTLYKAK